MNSPKSGSPDRRLPGTVVVLGLVSFFNDIASDMIIPLLPVFLTTVLGAGPAALGLMEGLAESASSLLKLWSGKLVDKGASQKRLALAGYIVSNAARPFLAMAGSWPMALTLRFADRVGKGLRTTPRDSLLSRSVDKNNRGRAFGFHRSMDHAGAMVGPLVAAGLLAFGLGMRDVFLLSVIPGVAAVLLLALGAREPEPAARPVEPVSEPIIPWRELDRKARAMIIAGGGLALATAPDAFFALWLSQAGVQLELIPALWAAGHLVKAVVAMPAGRLSDNHGRFRVAISAWILRGAVVAVIPWFEGVGPAAGLFMLYCAAAAGSEGAERALIGDSARPGVSGAAFGMYHMTVGIMALPGALLFGAVWQVSGPKEAFGLSCALTILSAGAALMAVNNKRGRGRGHA
ncbi:MAG: MFS transporter [Nitrospinae bacterium]|nr:MFS transporter [Nitrospinota bacterium]